MMKRRPVVVVLAAGRGMRFRGPGHKLEQALGSETVLGCTLKSAIGTRLRVVVVTSTRLAPAVRSLVASRDVIELPDFDTQGRPQPLGMGHSIAAGVAATGDAEGWLILPADMPMLRPSSLLAVAQALEQHPVAFAQYRGQRGWHDELSHEETRVHAADPYTRQLEHFAAVIAGQAQPLCSALDGLRTLAATLAVHDAAVSGQAVRLEN